jgi:hypothetical protein
LGCLRTPPPFSRHLRFGLLNVANILRLLRFYGDGICRREPSTARIAIAKPLHLRNLTIDSYPIVRAAVGVDSTTLGQDLGTLTGP